MAIMHSHLSCFAVIIKISAASLLSRKVHKRLEERNHIEDVSSPDFSRFPNKRKINHFREKSINHRKENMFTYFCAAIWRNRVTVDDM